MISHSSPTIEPAPALSKSPNLLSRGDISGSSPPRSTPDHGRHLTSVTRVAGETRNVVSSGEHTVTVEAKEGRVNSYSSSRFRFADPNTLREDRPDGPTPNDVMSKYLSDVVNLVSHLRKSDTFPSSGVAEEPLFHSLENLGSRDEQCRDSNNEAPEEQPSSLTSDALSLDFSLTGIIGSKTDQESSGKPVSSPIQYTLSLEDVAFNNVSGADPPPPVDDIPSTGASSVVATNESSPDHTLYATQLPYSRAASTTDGQSSPESAVHDGVPEDTDLKPDMLESSCPAPERSRVNVVSKSETLANISDAAPGSMVKVDVGKPTLSLENGRFYTIEHLCKFLEALPHVAVLNFQEVLVESAESLRHNPQWSFNYITHIDISDTLFESINTVADLLCCLPSLTTCSLRAILIRLKTEIENRFKEGNKLKVVEILVHGEETHSMGEITKLLFQPDNDASLFDKSVVEKLELCWLGWDGTGPYYVNEANGSKLHPSVSIDKLQDLKIILRLSFKPFDDRAWTSLGSNAPNLKRIEINISWEESLGIESRYGQWAVVLRRLDLGLWQCRSGQWPELKTLILRAHNFPPGMNILGDAFENIFSTDPAKHPYLFKQLPHPKTFPRILKDGHSLSVPKNGPCSISGMSAQEGFKKEKGSESKASPVTVDRWLVFTTSSTIREGSTNNKVALTISKRKAGVRFKQGVESDVEFNRRSFAGASDDAVTDQEGDRDERTKIKREHSVNETAVK
ncbi:hypothetical protein ARMSODRAFT_981544 [Armillaria solidipes]|uniref:Uncharacterized protein n=1 Tax=Armillaria solidipes TaxID=1076256 RepID=A0A2H3B2V7_9AGAR|nr:hypothetical protein ARMSODRAFT_981544 [Armillaria solidipes]